MYQPDIKGKIIRVLKREYQNELNSPKGKKTKNQVPIVSTLAFADITVWFYKRNCQQSLEEAKNVWDLLPQNPLQKQPLNAFLDMYTEEIMDKYNKYIHYRNKTNVLEPVYRRIQSLVDSLSISHNISDEGSSAENPKEDTASFSICVKSVQGHDLSAVFQNSDLIGHHIEIGHKDDTVSTSIEGTDGSHIDFKNTKITYNMGLAKPSVTVSLYEDYVKNGYQYKILVARRDIDLFAFLANPASSPTVKGAESYEDAKSNCIQLIKTSKHGEFGEGHYNINEERLTSDQVANLSVSVSLEGHGKDSFSQYVETLHRRLAYLEKKLKKLKLKTTGYKKKLMLMILPFEESIAFDGDSILVNEKAESKKAHQHEKCNIF